MIQHHKLSLLERYVFCTAPIRFKLKSEDTNGFGAALVGTSEAPATLAPIDKSNWLATLMQGPKTQQQFFLQFVADYANLGEVPFYIEMKKVKSELKKRQINRFSQIETLESVYWSTTLLTLVCESYLWLNYKFPAEFFEIEKVKDCQKSVVEHLSKLISEQNLPQTPRKTSRSKSDQPDA